MSQYNMEKNINDMAAQGTKELKKSGKDWLDYVQTHPLQSMLFGIVIYFSLKGMMRS